MSIKIQHPFIKKFPGDHSMNTMQRQTPGQLYCLVKPIGFPNAQQVHLNQSLAEQLNIQNSSWNEIFNANIPDDVPTYATAYAGHQFGHWAGQLGDGRAIFLGEIIDKNQQPWELQWKGAGATPYSRHADGRAVLRSTIREYLMSEAMYHLGVPTTRALSISLSGEDVMRDIMYNGNAAYEPGAVMVRTAKSFMRFGHFEYITASGDNDLLQSFTDWVIERYFPEIENTSNHQYLDFFRSVQNRTIKMILEWYRVGFVHGVMNTDNMSILGLTIDYGPYAMLEDYNLKFTPNTTDLPGRRYAFGQQANIALWNLNALANALFPLINDADALQEVLGEYEPTFWKGFDEMMANKLGLDHTDLEANQQIIKSWQIMMMEFKADYSLFFVELMKYRQNKADFNPEKFMYSELNEEQNKRLKMFLQKYDARLNENGISESESLAIMQKNNPQFTLRNYLLYDAIQDAEKGDYTKFEKLYDTLQNPYENKYPELQKKRPDWAKGIPGCSMLSCSS